MAVTSDILRSWRGPRAVMRDLLAMGKREDRAIMFLMIACILVFVAQWPVYARYVAGFEVPAGTDEFTMTNWLTYGAFAWIMVAPLALYGLAAVIHIIARIVGGRGSFYSARLALFWSLLASVPLLLLYGLTAGFIGPGIQKTVVGAAWCAGFLWIFVPSLREAEAG